MTERQRALLLFVQRHIARTGLAPTFEEMAEALETSSKSAIHRMVEALVHSGHLQRARKNAIRSLIVARPIPDDHFDDAVKAALKATGLDYSEAQAEAARRAFVETLICQEAAA